MQWNTSVTSSPQISFSSDYNQRRHMTRRLCS